MTLRHIAQHARQPERAVSESSLYAVKVSAALWNYDVSFSYLAGRDDLPLANSVLLTPVDALGTVDIDVGLIYPKMQVIGADVAGQIKTVGVWAEGAPKELKGTRLGLHSTIVGIALFPASVIAGLLWNTFGPVVPFALGASLSFASALILAFGLSNKAESVSM